MKEKILARLALAQPGRVSGQELGDELGVTRAAVWKAVEALRAEGFVVESAAGGGYRLLGAPNRVRRCLVQNLLTTRALGRAMTVLDEAGSTNAVLREKAASGGVHGETVLARRQTAGRGRLGRSFHSPQDGGVYLSVLLTRGFDPAQVTIRAAAAVHRAVAALCGLTCEIKWVNDLLLDGRKICGILTEGVCELETGAITGAVCGIGVNVGGGFPPELQDIAGALPADTDKNALAAAVLNELEKCLDEDFETLLAYYRRHCPLPGQCVTVRPIGAEAYEARAVAIDEKGRLVVERGGERIALPGGEVSLHREH